MSNGTTKGRTCGFGGGDRGGSRIFGDYSSNLLGSEPRPPCLRDTPTIWANDKPCVFIVASYS